MPEWKIHALHLPSTWKWKLVDQWSVIKYIHFLNIVELNSSGSHSPGGSSLVTLVNSVFNSNESQFKIHIYDVSCVSDLNVQRKIGEIWCLHSGDYEEYTLLGYNTV
jgi:hypothetical protein